MNRKITVEITLPEEYADAHPDIVLEDLLHVRYYDWPEGFEFECVADSAAPTPLEKL